MNRLRKSAMIVVLTATLGGQQAQALDPGIIGQLGQLGQLFNEWKSKIESFKGMYDQLFGSVNIQDLGNKFASRMADVGLSKLSAAVGIDIPKVFNDFKNWQSKIQEMKDGIMQGFNDKISTLFKGSNFDLKNKLAQAGMLNPDTFLMKFDGLIAQQREAINKADNVQDLGDAAKALVDSKQTVETTQKTSMETTIQAAKFGSAAKGIQSTREGVQMLVQAQAAMLANQAYNATALTNALSQNARQAQVTNNQLSELVNDRIEERTGEVLGAMHSMRLAEAEAVAMGLQVKENITWAAEGFSSAFKEPDKNVNSKNMF